MKHLKRIIVLALALVMCISLLPAVTHAASTKTVYVVSGITVTESGTKTSVKPAYNENGLITKINAVYYNEKISDTFKYSGTKVIRHTMKVLTGDHKGQNNSTKYTWKGGKITQRDTSYAGGSKETLKYKYDSKNRVSKEISDFGTTKFTYKNGHVNKATNGQIVYAAKFDSKGNITQWTRKIGKDTIGTYKATLTYGKSGRLTKLKATTKPNPMVQKKFTRTLSFKYKKVTVPASAAKKIADQQWQLINSYCFNNCAVSFAW